MYTALRLQLREVTDAQRRELKEAFQLFDADRTGALDLHELKVTAPILNSAH
jgi:Ca2+-binding EF-hand superfamily protein